MSNSRWSQFRSTEDSIPTHPFEAGVFLQNARLHLLSYGYSSIDARLIIDQAHGRVNDSFFEFKEVAA